MRLPRTATSGALTRVTLPEGEPAWVPTSATGNGSGGALQMIMDRVPPSVGLRGNPDLVTRSSSITLQGEAQDNEHVRDMYIFAGARKVFYQSNAGGANPRSLTYEAEVPLHPGINYVTVFARESNDVVSRRLMVIRRDGAQGELLETPRFDDSIFGESAH